MLLAVIYIVPEPTLSLSVKLEGAGAGNDEGQSEEGLYVFRSSGEVIHFANGLSHSRSSGGLRI